jgi:peptidoglycan/LPS O-acetylase OafA/YrhL
MVMSYWRFLAMIVVSTVVMFGLMYLNTYAFDHVFYSQTRAWMALVMGAAMAIVMIGFMWSMYRNAAANLGIVVAGLLVFAGALWLVRSQETVDDLSYMKAMIPHHSIAIMTSERAHIRDPRVRELADGIIEAQVREIGEMKALIADLKRNPTPDSAPDIPSYRERGAPAPAKE